MAAINSLQKAVIYETIMDEYIRAGLTSAPLEGDASRVKYNGGDSCKIATVSTGGFGTYDRGSTGYPQGAVTQAWETKTITQDRGVKFLLDVMDEDETAGVLSTSNVITEFSKGNAIPELDAYRYSTIFQNIVDDATVKYGYYTPTAATLFSTIVAKQADIQNVIGENEPLVCFISGAAFKYITTSSELQKELYIQNVVGSNGVNTKVYSLNGMQLIPVPSDRMKTEYAFSATNGFAAKAWAMDINFIIMSPRAAVAFVKHNKIKVISADQNQSADGELIMARTVHDLWVYDNKKQSMYVSLKTATIAGFSAAELLTPDATHVTYTIANYATRDTGHKFYYFDGGSVVAKTAPAAYDEFTLTGYVEITSASAVNDVVTSGYFGALVEIDENGRAVRFETLQASAG